MSSSESSPQNTTATSTSLTTTNQNVSGNQGITNLGGTTSYASSNTTNATDSGNTLSVTNNSTTDYGAIDAATGLGEHALDVAASVNNRALGSIDSAQQTVSKIANTAIDATGSAYGAALTAVQHNTDNTVDIISGIATQFGTDLEKNFNDSQTQLANVVSALNSTYTANNTSANQQVINAVTSAGAQSSNVIKYVAVAAVIAVVAIFVLRK